MVLTDAEATLAAARITAEATRWAGWLGFFGGCLALVGAVWVGLKQTHILQKQDEILRANFHLERSRLKLQLFEQRFDIYLTATNVLVFYAILLGVDNLYDNISKKELNSNLTELNSIFRKAIDISYFLFENKKVFIYLLQIISIIDELKDENGIYSIDIAIKNGLQTEIKERMVGIRKIFEPYLAVDNINI